MDEFQRALDLMAESVAHMDVSPRNRELIKAAMRCAIDYAHHRRAGYELSPAAKERQRSHG